MYIYMYMYMFVSLPMSRYKDKPLHLLLLNDINEPI